MRSRLSTVLLFGVLLASFRLNGLKVAKDKAVASTIPLTTPRTVAPASLAQFVTVVTSGESVDLRLEIIHGLLRRLPLLSPADRGIEDDIRRRLAGLLTDENAATIVQAVAREYPDEEFTLSALARWSAHDLPSAVLWLQQQPDASYDETQVLARALARDRVTQEVICEQLPVGAWREALLESTSRALAADDVPAAAALAGRLQVGPGRQRTLRAIADEWAQCDPSAAAQWMAAEPDPVLRDDLVMAGAVAQASTDPLAAYNWALTIRSDEVFEHATNRIGSLWADYAPEAAGDFTGRLFSTDKAPATASLRLD